MTVCNIPLIVHLRVIKMANFMLYIFYHNKKIHTKRYTNKKTHSPSLQSHIPSNETFTSFLRSFYCSLWKYKQTNPVILAPVTTHCLKKKQQFIKWVGPSFLFCCAHSTVLTIRIWTLKSKVKYICFHNNYLINNSLMKENITSLLYLVHLFCQMYAWCCVFWFWNKFHKNQSHHSFCIWI